MQLTPEQVKGRIKNVAKENKADARTLMRIYMMERFLERVASSQYKDNFIIKGGMLVTAMVGVALRSTMDIDTTAEELPATIAYGKLKTLMNIRKKPSLDAEVVAVYKKNALVEVVQFCDGWLKIKCAEAEAGVAYVLNSADTYAFTAGRIYTVVPGDNLWKIAEKELGSGSRCADIRVLNGLTSNAIRVGMKLLIP